MTKYAYSLLTTIFLTPTLLFSQWEHPNFKIFSGNATRELSQAVAEHLHHPLSKAKVERFNDGEPRIEIDENVRNSEIYVIQSTCPSETSSVNDNLVELYLMIRALKRASAENVMAIIPYYGYGRQDRKLKGRVPISASDVAMLLELAGADRVMAIDLHCGQIQGFFHNVPVDNLFASRIFAPYIAEIALENPVVISPDAGGVERAKRFIDELSIYGIDSGLAIIVKQRAEAGVVESMNLVGNVSESDVIIIDDICDTAGTLCQAAQELKNQGAKRVFACITHPLFSGKALERIANSAIDQLIVTDTVPLRGNTPKNVVQLSVAPLIAEAILRTHNGESLSDLFTH